VSAAGEPLTGYSAPSNLALTVTTVCEPSDLTISSLTCTSSEVASIRWLQLRGAGLLSLDRSALNTHVLVNGSGWFIDFSFYGL
jgi:hypothetical protein